MKNTSNEPLDSSLSGTDALIVQLRDVHMSSQEEIQGSRPNRRLTLLFIATGGTFAFVATVFGALMLANLSGVTIPFDFRLFASHPYLQIFGFLSEFVMGVAFSLLPLFKSRKLPEAYLAYACYVLATTANLLILLAVVSDFESPLLFELSALLILASSVIFALEVFRVLGRPSKFLGEAEPFMWLSAISFILISAYLSIQESNPDTSIFSPAFLYLSLAGFVGSMIYGVELRTVAFRLTTYSKTLAKTSAAVQGLSIAFAFLGSFVYMRLLDDIASITFLVAAALFVISAKTLERSRVLLPIGSTAAGGNEVKIRNRIFSYSELCATSSSAWLLFSCSLGVIWLAFGFRSSFAFYDSFIHSLAIGFIGSAIISYAPLLLPGILSRRAPAPKLSLWPIILLNLGLILRDAGNFYAWAIGSVLPVWESTSGILILGAMIFLMKNLHFSKAKT